MADKINEGGDEKKDKQVLDNNKKRWR
jgi:hypothetical protein